MTKKISQILLLLSFSHLCFSNEIIREFHSDYCTFLNIKDPQVEKCCYTHDLYYWVGGRSEDRKQVDLDFKECISGHDKKLLALIMYSGVKAGSLSPWKFTGKQWGNAWGDQVRGQRLHLDEIESAEQSLFEQGVLSAKEIEDFIQNLKQRDELLK